WGRGASERRELKRGSPCERAPALQLGALQKGTGLRVSAVPKGLEGSGGGESREAGVRQLAGRIGAYYRKAVLTRFVSTHQSATELSCAEVVFYGTYLRVGADGDSELRRSCKQSRNEFVRVCPTSS